MSDKFQEPEEQVEIVDLPDPRPTRQMRFQGKTTRKGIGIFLTIFTVIMAGLLLNSVTGNLFYNQVSAKVSSLFAPQGTPTSSSLVKIEAQIKLEPVITTPPEVAPKNCPQSAAVDSKQTIGAPPVWVSGFEGPRALAHLKPLQRVLITRPDTPQVDDGTWNQTALWGMHVAIILQPGFTQAIQLTLSSTSGDSAPTFGSRFPATPYGPGIPSQTDSSGTYQPGTSSTTLDPRNPKDVGTGVKVAGPYVWEADIYIDQAGCYTLTASWGNSWWSGNFSAGL